MSNLKDIKCSIGGYDNVILSNGIVYPACDDYGTEKCLTCEYNQNNKRTQVGRNCPICGKENTEYHMVNGQTLYECYNCGYSDIAFPNSLHKIKQLNLDKWNIDSLASLWNNN